MPEPDDKTLVAGLLAGQQDAFEALAQRYGKAGFAIAYSMLRNRADADEVLQEALVRVWFNADQWQPARGSFATWFRRIVINLAIDRSRTQQPTEELETEIRAPGSAADQAAGRELEREIACAMQTLPPRQLAALALCYTDEMSCAEGAKVLGISVSAMESLLVRGRRTVRRHLEQVGLLLAGEETS